MKRYISALIVITMTGFILSARAQTQKMRAVAADTSVAQQPLYSDYKGVTLGMTATEVRAKLGNPVLKDDELDYYVFSDILSAQVAYDSSHKAKVISVDFAGGVGAPDYRAVVGAEIITRTDGSVLPTSRLGHIIRAITRMPMTASAPRPIFPGVVISKTRRGAGGPCATIGPHRAHRHALRGQGVRKGKTPLRRNPRVPFQRNQDRVCPVSIGTPGRRKAEDLQ